MNLGMDTSGTTALGSESAPSAPGDGEAGLGDPKQVANARLNTFTKHTQRRYGNVSDVKGALWDPRGNNALTDEVADYRKTGLMQSNEIPLEQLTRPDPGAPVPGYPKKRTYIDRSHLLRSATGMSKTMARQVGDTFSAYHPSILEGIQLSQQTEPKIANELGFVTPDGGMPQPMLNDAGGVRETVSQGVTRLIVGKTAQLERSDANGVARNYDKGTGPYDAPGRRYPSVHASLTTPAERQASAATAMTAADVVNGNGDGVTMYANDAEVEAAAPKSKFPWLIIVGLGLSGLGLGIYVKRRK